MKPKEFKKQVEKIIKVHGHDSEIVHVLLDELMESVLSELGYHEGIEVIQSQERWYG